MLAYIAAHIFGDIAAANIVVDDIIQTISDDNTAVVSFTVEHGDLLDIKPVIETLVKELGAVFPPSSLTSFFRRRS